MKVFAFALFCFVCVCVFSLSLTLIYARASRQVKSRIAFDELRLSLIKLEKQYSKYVSEHGMKKFPEIKNHLAAIQPLVEDSYHDFSSTVLKPMGVRKSLFSPLCHEILRAPRELKEILSQYSEILHKLTLIKYPIRGRIWSIKKKMNVQILTILLSLVIFIWEHLDRKRRVPTKRVNEVKQLEEMAKQPDQNSPNVYITT